MCALSERNPHAPTFHEHMIIYVGNGTAFTERLFSQVKRQILVVSFPWTAFDPHATVSNLSGSTTS